MPTTSNSTLYIVKNPNDRKRTPPNVIIKEQDQQQQQTENEIKRMQRQSSMQHEICLSTHAARVQLTGRLNDDTPSVNK